MRKRIISLSLALALLLALLPVSAFAAEVVESGTFGSSKLTYVLDSDGVLTISGSGEMMDGLGTSYWNHKHGKDVKTVVIKPGVTTIGRSAFHSCWNLTSVTVPNTVTSIHQSAFQNCTALTSITLPDSVTTIERSAFWECSNLETITLGKRLQSIGAYAFGGTKLTTVYYGGTRAQWDALDIDKSFSRGTPSMTNEPILKANVYCEGALTGVNADGSTWSKTDDGTLTTTLGNSALTERPDGTATIQTPDNTWTLAADGTLTVSGSGTVTKPAFAQWEKVNDGVKKIVIADGVTAIGDEAFRGCANAVSITVPVSVTTTGRECCAECHALKTVYYLGSELQFESINRASTGSTYAGAVIDFAVKTVSLSNFKKTRTYTQGQFNDVPAGQWYTENVATAYAYDLMVGNSNTTFNPSGNLTIAEAVTMAARIHNTYFDARADFTQGNPWYQVYVDYAIENGIIQAGTYSNYTATATRAQYAAILAGALPPRALKAINSITALPDLAAGDARLPKILMLYNAGVLTGSDDYGTFGPEQNIQRNAAAAIVTRMVDTSLRRSFSLKPAVATGLTLNYTDEIVYTGKTLQLTATVTPADAYRSAVTWSSSDTAVATVSASGLVTFHKEGSATVTARTPDGVSATCQFTVFLDPTPYEYLIRSDFDSVKRKYSTATPLPLAARVYAYTDKDGNVIAVTFIRYQIITNWEQITYHNMTTGYSTEDPDSYFTSLENSAAGSRRSHYMDLHQQYSMAVLRLKAGYLKDLTWAIQS